MTGSFSEGYRFSIRLKCMFVAGAQPLVGRAYAALRRAPR